MPKEAFLKTAYIALYMYHSQNEMLSRDLEFNIFKQIFLGLKRIINYKAERKIRILITVRS